MGRPPGGAQWQGTVTMTEKNHPPEISVSIFTPADAAGIRDLFSAVYGDAYPVRTYYEPEALIAAVDAGDILPFAARTPDGDVVGCIALFRSAPNATLYESGVGIVLPAYRSRGISSALFTALMDPDTLNGRGVAGVWGEAVANHVFMQKICLNLGFCETGLEVDLMPAEAYDKENSASGRVGSVVLFRTIAARPQTLYLPARYAQTLRRICAGLDDDRTLSTAGSEPPAAAETRIDHQVYGFAGVARLAVTGVGGDFGGVLGALTAELCAAQPLHVIQAAVNLACPWCGHAVEALWSEGFFLGGLLPRWFDDDALLMQKILAPPSWDGLVLHSERIRRLRDEISADWAARRPPVSGPPAAD